MSSRPLIAGTAIGKFYYRGCSIPQHAANLILGTSHGERFWALEPMNISVSRGEAVGVIGRNGSGKSTLLQILCRTVKPNSGYVDVNGRVAGLLELGAGFSPDFTGRENAVMNAAVHGLKEKEIQARLPAIADFAGIGDYFDRPVREYSSGMFARLAFAVATHVDADLLVVDEILAVGDAAFQRKCMARMRQFREAGGALLFVSHSSLAVLSVCERSIWLDHGAFGKESRSVVDFFRRWMADARDHARGAFGQYNGCAVANFALQTEIGQEEMQSFIRETGRRWQSQLVAYLRSEIRAGKFPAQPGAAVTARRMLLCNEGAILMWKITGNLQYFDDAVQMFEAALKSQ